MAIKVNTVISEIGLIDMESFACDNSKGFVEITFVRGRPDEPRRKFVCRFDSFVVFKISHEDFDTNNDSGFPEVSEPKIEYFGNVMKTAKSYWLDRYKESTQFVHSDNQEPDHYLIISSEDIIEVLSHDFPNVTEV